MKLYHDTLVEHGVQGYSVRPVLGGLPPLDAVPAGVLRDRSGRLDLANERGIDLFTKISQRTLAAIDDLKAYRTPRLDAGDPPAGMKWKEPREQLQDRPRHIRRVRHRRHPGHS